jgi:hypothetical protein
MTDLRLRRKLTFRAHGRTLVLAERSNEKIEPWCSIRQDERTPRKLYKSFNDGDDLPPKDLNWR